jgi:uncharacterized phage-associated protein
MYSPRRVAQMAAFFARKQGGTINVLKLTKLLYLSDRVSLARYGHPITYDRPVSMPHGPVLSQSLGLMNGFVGGAAGAQWDEWMKDRSGHDIHVKRNFTRDDLDEISDADLEVLEAIWHEFGPMDQWTLRSWTHNHCSEWKDPKGSSIPIDEATLLESVGIPAERAAALAEEIEKERRLDALFSLATHT